MNKNESERLAARFEALGYSPVNAAADADTIVLNSCVVRQSAENRVINKLAILRAVKKAKPEVRLALTGCLVGEDTEALQKRFPHVDYFFRPGDTPPGPMTVGRSATKRTS